MKKIKQKHVVKARTGVVVHEGRDVMVPLSDSYRFFVCNCDPPCGNVSFIFEDMNGRPFGCAQLSYEQVLGPLTECALGAKKLVGEKTH